MKKGPFQVQTGWVLQSPPSDNSGVRGEDSQQGDNCVLGPVLHGISLDLAPFPKQVMPTLPHSPSRLV